MECYQDNHTTIYNMNFLDNDLPAESIQCVVTSPPYWGLRKYSGEQELIWGDKDCVHEWGNEFLGDTRAYGAGIGQWQNGTAEGGRPHYKVSQGSIRSLCGAWKGAFGLEPTPEMYVQHTIEILREIRRVLRKDGVVFWNIGDSYASGKGTCHNPGGNTSSFNVHLKEANVHPLDRGNKSTLARSGLKPKDLVLIPFRVALEAQADGWWVRSVIIWNKPNPMPESVTDRPTESHEYILMLTKSAKYYWDADAVREQGVTSEDDKAGHRFGGKKNNEPNSMTCHTNMPGKKWDWTPGRNIRSVWEFPTQPYPEAHFAIFPEKLPETCIKAATPEEGCCSKCGAPWERIVDTQYRNDTTKSGRPARGNNRPESIGQTKTFASGERTRRIDTTLGWQPTCKCNADKVPSIVLDPFMGSGTTLWVAKKLNREAIGFDISEEYCQLAIKRNRQQGLL